MPRVAVIGVACLAPVALAGDPPLHLGSPEVAEALISGATDCLVVGDSQNTYGEHRGQIGIMRTWAPERWSGRFFSGKIVSATSGVRVVAGCECGGCGDPLCNESKFPEDATGDSSEESMVFPRHWLELSMSGDLGSFDRLVSFRLSHLEDDYLGGDPFLGSGIAMKAAYRDEVLPDLLASFRYRPFVYGSGVGPWTTSTMTGAGVASTETVYLPAGFYSAYELEALELRFVPTDGDETGAFLQLSGATFWTVDDAQQRTGGLVLGASAIGGYGASTWLDTTTTEAWASWLGATTTDPDHVVFMVMLGHNDEVGSFEENLDGLLDRLSQAATDALGQQPMFLLVAPWDTGFMTAGKRDAMVQLTQTRPEPTLFVSLFDIYGEGVNPFQGGQNNDHPESDEEAEDWASKVWEQVVLAAGGCGADFNGDGAADILDFVAFQAAFTGGDPAADCDGSGELDVLDFVCFQSLFQQGCP